MPLDMSAAYAPPTPPPPATKRRGRPPGSTNKATANAAPKMSSLEMRYQGVQGIGQLIQGGLMLTKNYADAAAVGMHWDGVAKEVATLAEAEPAVARIVDLVIQAGPYAGLIAAVMPLAMQLAANHGMIPSGGMSGVVPPEVLQSQMEARILQQQAEALRQRQEALREAEAAKNDLQAFLAAQEAQVRDGVENRGWDPALHGVNNPR